MTRPSAARSARRPRAEWERRILESALVTFGREGYGVSINRLIADSGAPVGTFYRLFPDKDALFGRLMADLHPGYLKRILEEVGDASDPGERLGRTVRALVVVGAREYGGVARLYFTDVRGRGPAAHVARRADDDEVALLCVPIRDGVAEGTFDCASPELAALGILGLTRKTVEAYVLGRRHPPLETAADQAATVVVRGLRAPSSPRPDAR
jgi:AcrR family transcriptional regulator